MFTLSVDFNENKAILRLFQDIKVLKCFFVNQPWWLTITQKIFASGLWISNLSAGPVFEGGLLSG